MYKSGKRQSRGVPRHRIKDQFLFFCRRFVIFDAMGAKQDAVDNFLARTSNGWSTPRDLL